MLSIIETHISALKAFFNDTTDGGILCTVRGHSRVQEVLKQPAA